MIWVRDKEPHFVKETLDWCNSKRLEKKKKPLKKLPKGRITDARSCPCGAATGLVVGAFNYYDSDSMGVKFKLPDSVVEFVRQFDNGKLPQYIEKERDI